MDKRFKRSINQMEYADFNYIEIKKINDKYICLKQTRKIEHGKRFR